MDTTFIERLSSAQIKEFLNEVFPDTRFAFNLVANSIPEATKIDVFIFDISGLKVAILKDFEALIIGGPDKWYRYLYKVFGDEYKEAFLKRQAREIFGDEDL